MAEFTPRDDELTDPRVGQLLWRLRARLVVPPDADRAEQDLARLLASAQEHAHDAPGADDSVDRSLRPEPVVRLSLARRASSGMAVGRLAAALVLLAAVGGGIASARDGQLSLQVLLGTTTGEGQPIERAAPEPSSESETPQDAGAADPLPELEALELDAPDPADGVPDVEVEAEPQAEAPTTAPDGDGALPTPGPDPDDGSAESGSDVGSGSRTPEPEPDPELDEAPEPGEPRGPVEAQEPGEPQGSEVIAAPAARDLDGFGGPQPCPEDQALASCLEDRAGVEEGEDGDSRTGGDATGDGADPGDDPTGDVGADPDGGATSDSDTSDSDTSDAGTGESGSSDTDDDVTADDGADPGEDTTSDSGDDRDEDTSGDEGSGSEQDELARRRGAG